MAVYYISVGLPGGYFPTEYYEIDGLSEAVEAFQDELSFTAYVKETTAPTFPKAEIIRQLEAYGQASITFGNTEHVITKID